MVPPKPSYVKTLTAEQWANAPLSERALHVARSQERNRVRELSPNWGGMVTIYLRVAGWRSPAPWCAAFVFWCLLEAGADRKKLWANPASTYSMFKWAVKTSRLTQMPKRGNAFVWNGAGGGHTGFVVSGVLDGEAKSQITTIEGNTDDAGSREGVRVAQRVRTIAGLRRFPRWGFIDLGGIA